MSNTRKYWQSIEQLNEDPGFVEKNSNEFSEELPIDEFLGKKDLGKNATSRRDFLKFVGFSVAAATLAACEAPVIKSIPYVVKPEDVMPGIANYYASAYFDGFDYGSIVVKTREGRPIHIEGNKLSPVGNGGVSARVNASLLGLYDTGRSKKPLVNGSESDWNTVDKEVKKVLDGIRASGGTVRVLSNTIASPSTEAAIRRFAESFTNEENTVDFKHVTYDVHSASGIREAHKESFGTAFVPGYRFDKANVIVSFGADFLTTWLNPVEFATQYAKNRKPENGKMSRHYQFEANYSVTGTNADIRGAVKPSEQGLAVIALYNELAAKAGRAKITGKKFDDDNQVADKIKKAAADLWKNKGKSLVVCNSNDVNVQVIVNAINDMLDGYGATLDDNHALNLRKGNDAEFVNLVNEMKAGKVDALFIYGVNPVYSAASLGFGEALKKVKFSVSFADRPDETGSAVNVLACDNHYFESWNDYNPYGGHHSVAQPVIRPLFDTRQAQESFLKWSGENTSFYDFMKSYWKENLFPRQRKHLTFDAFWNHSVQDGVVELFAEPTEMNEFAADLNAAASKVVSSSGSKGFDVELYFENAIGTGNHANNPWLQELPHSLTKVVWDNYIAMNPADMVDANGNEIYNTRYGQQEPASMAEITVNGQSLKLPVIALPGQKRGSVSIALGYGRTKAGKVVAQGDMKAPDGSPTIGANAYPLVAFNNGAQSLFVTGAEIKPLGETYPIGLAQTHFTEMDRKIVNETSMKTFKSSGKEVWNPVVTITDAYGKNTPVSKVNLWPDQDIDLGHRWGMTIDLNLCIGCGSCVTSCHSENNVPVVGKDEVRRNRIMNWLRIDRYFASDMNKEKAHEEGLGKIAMYREMEIPSDYPEAVHQPVMCQQCNHAPCETVCPVAATTHSNEGLNQMTYNRCIGTRYCANNCPYKVRRFNWFNYVGDSKFTEVNPSQDDLGRMVLNPDVVVRSRGVMEKCSFCVQRIQAGKLTAKKEGRPVKDGEIISACAAVCPTNAIQFGDLNDSETAVSATAKSERSYHLLEEVGTQPNVFYLTKVRNIDEERIPAGLGHGGGEHGHNHGEEAAHQEEAHNHKEGH